MQTLCLCSAIGPHLAKASLRSAERHCATEDGALARMLILGILLLTVGCDRHSSSSRCGRVKCVGWSRLEEEEGGVTAEMIHPNVSLKST